MAEHETVSPENELEDDHTATCSQQSFFDEDDFQTCQVVKDLAQKETQAVNLLRVLTLGLLVGTGVLVSTCTFLHIRRQERQNFELHFGYSAAQVIEGFHTFVEHTMSGTAGLSNQITSFALDTGAQFPCVTLPNFEMIASDIKAQSGSHMVHYAPIVTDETRPKWEEFALENRGQTLEALAKDNEYRSQQDAEFGSVVPVMNSSRRAQAAKLPPKPDQPLVTVLSDGYHPHIPAGGASKIRRDQPEGAGPFAPLWQASPLHSGSMHVLNNDLGTAGLVVPGILDIVATQKKAVINFAALAPAPYRPANEMMLRSSQYRHRVADLIDDLHTWLVYPVFDTFDEKSRSVVGIIVTDVYWKILLSNLLPSHMRGIDCVVSNSFGQEFTYRLNGGVPILLGMGDHHDKNYDEMAVSTDVGIFLEERASPETRGFGAVPLSNSTSYRIRVYPSRENESAYLTHEPHLYTIIASLIFSFASIVFLTYSCVVDRRQNVMTSKVVKKSERMAKLEQNINEFFSHEIRNPLASAITATSFLDAALQEPNPTPESQRLAREDIEAVKSSLNFINDFMRSMLDIYRAAAGRITVDKAPTDVKTDILEPVATIMRHRGVDYDVLVECPDNLIVMTDRIRLTQIVLNLSRNAAKFVEVGYIKLRAGVDPRTSHVTLYCEDTGPGVSKEKRSRLFSRYQVSLDSLSQGTGIGLNLSKQLCKILGGNLSLDETYHSSFLERPGARFVIDMETPPLDVEVAFPLSSETCEMEVDEGAPSMTLGCEDETIGPGPLFKVDASSDSTQPSQPQPLFKTNCLSDSNPASQQLRPLFKTSSEPDSNPASQPQPLFNPSSEPDPNQTSQTQPLLNIKSDGSVSNAASKPQPLFKVDSGSDSNPASLPSSQSHPLFLKKPSSELDPNQSSQPQQPFKINSGGSESNATTDNSSNQKQTPRPLDAPKANQEELPEGLSILFVDDDPMIRKLTVRALKRVAPASWTTHEASSGEMALEMCHNNDQEYSIIFLDQYMASVTKSLLGTETAQTMRIKGVRSKLIGLSANELRDNFLMAGADEFILKPMPCNPSKLKPLLNGILDLPCSRESVSAKVQSP
ncbi:respiration control sensor protein ArcB [Seminavis robusta]|uniref:histidine kinase n=1 Tax=Seminavis robusta TaxID=568900 RepID=A0A9N8DEN0_9STRA|nr:respiration control sensor protein ArcB [Seminavis robusta]|eukprot:Sro113_g055970.1 respiration control sensor protein ArcB (1093) ;mRNA; f:27530-31135